MTYRWNTRLQVEPDALKILIEDHQGDALKARLPICPNHPRALLTLLEGVALWSGENLHAALSVGGPRVRSSVEARWRARSCGSTSSPTQNAAVDAALPASVTSVHSTSPEVADDRR